MRIAAVAFQVEGRGWEGFKAKLSEVVAEAAALNSEVVVLPELVVLDALDRPHSERVAEKLGAFAMPFREHLQSLARAHRITVVGGSHIEDVADGFRNVCQVVAPDGSSMRTEKRVLTQWEAVEWSLSPGLVTESAPIASLICYDCEFPELARPLAEQGAKVLCVPSFTETRHGFQRVRWCCLARAIENQIFVVHASLLGSFGAEPIPSTYGSSAIIAPSVPPFPESAILAETPLGEPGIAVADLDFEVLEAARNSGDVRNWHDYLELRRATRSESLPAECLW